MSSRYGATESSRTKFLRAAPLLLIGLLYSAWNLLISQPALRAALRQEEALGLAHPTHNRTLGFGEILVAVVPSTTAEHFHHQLHTLSLASHRTHIDLRTFEGGGDKKFTKVWRGHMNMLRYMLDQHLETALLLEGSADWDLRVKGQLQALSERLLANGEQGSAAGKYPYGKAWSALWFSRCEGDGAVEEGWKKVGEVQDETLAKGGSAEDGLGEEMMRQVYQSQKSGCTVAYAVTAAGAQKILDEIGFEHVNLALEKAEGEKTYRLPGLVVTPPLFVEWEGRGEGEKAGGAATPKYTLGQSVRRALYNHH